MARPQRHHYTWDDYVRLPDDGKRYEILEGDLVVTPAPATGHQFTLAQLYSLVDGWVKGRAGGLVLFAPTDVVLAADTIVQPDLIWISPEREAEIVGQLVHGIPDLVVEVLSPSTSRRDRTRKADIYARHGAREYWLANPTDESVEIRRRDGQRFVRHTAGRGDAVLGSTLDPELRVVPRTLFRRFPVRGTKG